MSLAFAFPFRFSFFGQEEEHAPICRKLWATARRVRVSCTHTAVEMLHCGGAKNMHRLHATFLEKRSVSTEMQVRFNGALL